MVAKKPAVKQSTAAEPDARPGGKPDGKTGEKSSEKAGAKATGQSGKEAGKKPGKGPGKKASEKPSGKPSKKSPEKSTGKSAGAVAKKKTVAAPAKKSTAKKAAPATKAVPAKKTGAKKVAATETPGGASTKGRSAARGTAVPGARAATTTEPGGLAVRPNEEPWTPAEVAEARATLEEDAERLRAEIRASEEALTGLLRDSGDGAGDDQADTGTKNVTREHEMALTSNAREMLVQSERALSRLEAGTYGLCENCGNPIGKARMQAFPRATLCVECKQRQERR